MKNMLQSHFLIKKLKGQIKQQPDVIVHAWKHAQKDPQSADKATAGLPWVSGPRQLGTRVLPGHQLLSSP